MIKTLALFIFLISAFFVTSRGVHASTNNPQSEIIVQEVDTLIGESMDATKSSEVKMSDYILPYPGVLPDNPLHFLKAARDRMVSILINDPIKRAEFNLLTSDKRISAAELLMAKDKQELAISTLSKSNNYLDASIAASAEAKKMGKHIDTVLHNQKSAIIKHKEVVIDMKKSTSKKNLNQLQVEEKRLTAFEKSVSKLIPSK